MRAIVILILLFLAWNTHAATVTDDTVTLTLCSDGRYYSGGCPPASATYYINSSTGVDTASGLTPATAWRNLSKINTITQVGADVCLMAGSDWTVALDALTITHYGTQTDPAKIKGCYLDGGVATEYQSGSGVGRGNKPIIRGTITAACVQAYTCTGWANTGFLMSVRSTDVHIQYLSFFGSASGGIFFGNSGTSQIINLRRNVLRNVDFSHTGKQAVIVSRGVQEMAIKEISLTMASLCNEHAIATCGNWGSALTISQVPAQSRVLVENSDCYNTAGECFVATGNAGEPSSHVVFRGNRASDSHSTSFYPDMMTDVVVESNIGVGPSSIFTARNNANPFGGGIRSNVEILGQSNARILVRNNLSTNGKNYSLAASVYADGAALGKTTAVRAYGNTMVSTDSPADIGVLRSAVQFHFRGSVAYSTGIATKCSWTTALSGDFSFGYNLWDTAPSDSRCRGTGDKTGNPQFPLAYSAFDNLSYANMPTFASITPPVGSPLKASGDPALVTATCITDLANWGTWIFGQMNYPYTPEPAEWVLCLRRDAMGNLRSTTAPTIGAME